MKIYKYLLEPKERQIIRVNSYTTFSVIEQHDQLFAYVPCIELPTNEEYYVDFEFIIVGTGQTLPDDIDEFSFVQTVLMKNGLVFHIFYRQIYIPKEVHNE